MVCVIRSSEASDEEYLIQWLQESEASRWFPLANLREVQDAARIWVSYHIKGAALTAQIDGVPCGIANLYIQPCPKLAHQCLFAIIVSEQHRGKGIGTQLLKELIHLAKTRFHIRLLHLEVYEGNPAIELYKRLGFLQYGEQKHFMKENNRYASKIIMHKYL